MRGALAAGPLDAKRGYGSRARGTGGAAVLRVAEPTLAATARIAPGAGRAFGIEGTGRADTRQTRRGGGFTGHARSSTVSRFIAGTARPEIAPGAITAVLIQPAIRASSLDAPRSVGTDAIGAGIAAMLVVIAPAVQTDARTAPLPAEAIPVALALDANALNADWRRGARAP